MFDAISRFEVHCLQPHLTDSQGQGWRIRIAGWPRPTAVGAGCCTQADHKEIVRYAAKNFVTIVPEIESPAHSNASVWT